MKNIKRSNLKELEKLMICKNNFGNFIAKERLKKNISLRKMAGILNISPAYLCDIEKGNRYPPKLQKINEIIKALNLNEEESYELFDLAGEEQGDVSPDLIDFIMSNELVRLALRKAKEKDKLNSNLWQDFIQKLDK